MCSVEKMHIIYCIYEKATILLFFYMLKRLCSKLMKFCMCTSLDETFIQAKFQMKIRKYTFAVKMGILKS